MQGKPCGPLAGLRVVEFEAMGPAPFAGMMLSDLGADVVRLDRPVRRRGDPRVPLLSRGRRSVALDLSDPAGVDTARSLLSVADVALDGFRPGVAERMGIGPRECLRRNPRLIYGQMTGWGQDGPLRDVPGHDINFLAVAGALHAMGDSDRPPAPPLNVVGDFGGGGMLLAVGVLAALIARQTTGLGQVVDASMIDGAALLMTMVREMRAGGDWTLDRGANLVDGGAPFYRTYRTSDNRYVAVGAIEFRFYSLLLQYLGLPAQNPTQQWDRSGWPATRDAFARAFATRTRDEWMQLLEHSEACVSAVLDLDEASTHPHNLARATFLDGEHDPHSLASPAPRFSGTPTGSPVAFTGRGSAGADVLAEWLDIGPVRNAGVPSTTTN